MVASQKISNRALTQVLDLHAVRQAGQSGAYAEGRGISLEGLLPAAQLAHKRRGYGVYLESLLQSAAAAKDDDKESVRSIETSGSARSGETASTAAAPLPLGEAAAVALRTLRGPAVASAVLALQVHSLADLRAVATAVFESAVSAPARTMLAADLLVALMPFMVTCYDGEKAVTLLDEVSALCHASFATVTDAAPLESCFGAVLFFAHLFERRCVALATIKDVFAKLLFVAAPPDHAVNLACHALLAMPSLGATAAGAQMRELLVARLKELKGHSYTDATRACIAAMLEHDNSQKLAASMARRPARGGRRTRECIVRS